MPTADYPGRPRDIPLAAARGFTLIELMVSMALVLVIILGVNAIFKMTSDTVNAGQALAAANRDLRSSMTVVYNDFQNGVFTDGPMLLIRSERTPAFRSALDEQADRDGDPMTVDLDENNTEGEAGVAGEVTGPFTYNTRNHRIDRVSFFASHLYRRQTGTETPGGTRFIDDGASTEAYIWYGHLSQPDFGSPPGALGGYPHRGPGESKATAPNPNNYYATDWILGRSVTLLQETPPPGQNYIDFSASARLTPLSPDSRSALATSPKIPFAWSRYDLARTSINAFKGALQFDISDPRYGNNIVNDTWYELLGGEWANMGNARFQGYPYPDRPLTAYGLARTVPVFVRGCTQFIVEYAGDYLAQNPATGEIVETSPGVPNTFLNGQTDGQLDFVIAPEKSNPSATGGVDRVRRIRWYGMPRNVDTWDDPVGPPMIRGLGGKSSTYYDVVPLRDILENAGVTPDPAAFFEHFDQLEPQANYGLPNAAPPDPKKLRYYAAWGPNDLRKGSLTKPKMIRITMTVDDPNGRLTEGQTFEYVIDLP